MLSIPRDMYVKKPNGAYGKINSVFESAFYQNDRDYDKASPILLKKFTEITGIPLSYYAFIDFDGFEKFVDSIGGIEIDVPESIYDSSYPGENNSYIVFSIDS
jgi:anionic cell wall polymer biosynthesis LytR-Cps2A-Psr (LCP) family protein